MVPRGIGNQLHAKERMRIFRSLVENSVQIEVMMADIPRELELIKSMPFSKGI